MSLYGVMRTSTSGMNAQASRISTVAENVANSNTIGYKAVRTEFSSIFIGENISSYNSGSVDTNIHRLTGNQGTLVSTSSLTDLAIQGDGFFVVQDAAGENFLTRAGSFLPDGDGRLVNTAGFTLMGFPLTPGVTTPVVNGFAGMVPIVVDDTALMAAPSRTGVFSANMPANATIVPAANLPSANAATSTYSAKSSVVAYDNLGGEVLLDMYFSKTATGTWEMAAYNRADASATGGFPYASGPLSTATLTFDPATGQPDAASPATFSVAVPGGQTLDLDITGMSQLATGFTIQDARVDGNAASSADIVEIADDGIVYVAFGDGSRLPMFRIPTATVPSPDNLMALSGNVFTPTSNSGDVRIGFPGEPGHGEIASGVLEQSTADIAAEFTDMIDAQRGYTANSKVFQTGAELMDVLVNLKR